MYEMKAESRKKNVTQIAKLTVSQVTKPMVNSRKDVKQNENLRRILTNVQ